MPSYMIGSRYRPFTLSPFRLCGQGFKSWFPMIALQSQLYLRTNPEHLLPPMEPFSNPRFKEFSSSFF